METKFLLLSFEQHPAVLISTRPPTHPPDFEQTLTDRGWRHRVPVPTPLPLSEGKKIEII
jgi:hypothetical protein